jgi:hypothetical protein
MDNSLLFGGAWPTGFVVLMVFGGSMIALSLYFSLASKRELFSKRYFQELKERATCSRLGMMLTRGRIMNRKSIDYENG